MFYDSILARSFSKHEQKKLGYGALVGCLFIAFSFCIMLKPHLGRPLLLPVLNFQIFSRGSGIKMPVINEANSSQQLNEVAETDIKKTTPICSLTHWTDYCDFIDVNVRVDGESSSVFFASADMEISEGNSTWKVRPYARKGDEAAMRNTAEWSVKAVKNPHKMPQCTRNHSVPAILFSTGGYAGNHFHDFTDVVIPLFITAREFNGEVQFLITDTKPWWVLKYQAIISKLSKFDIINIDKETQVHCFPRAIVGLKRDDKELRIDPKKHPYSMRDFKEFLRSCYSLKRDRATENRGEGRGRRKGIKPQLLIVARRKTRSFTNTGEIRKMARKLGFKVIVMEPDANVKKVAEIVNSCDAMMGVHGAGLANIVFLPKNAVFLQIVPFGGGWAKLLSKNLFGEPSKDMELKYLQYNMSVEESTLIQQYPKDDVVLRDPQAIQNQGGWRAFKSVYFVKQNVNLDINRFRPTLLKAFELLQQ